MKTVILTGASSGIGRATAELLANEGHHLILSGRRPEALEGVAKAVVSKGGSADIVVGDVCAETTRAQIVAAASPLKGELVLINGAGVAEFGDVAKAKPADLVEQIEVNLVAPMLLSNLVLPSMLDAGAGQIIQILSIAAREAFAGAAAYGGSKAGLWHFSRSLNAEVRKHGVRVTSLLVGATDSEFWAGRGWVPPKEDMLTTGAVAEAIADLISMPRDRAIDELLLMPPKGIL